MSASDSAPICSRQIHPRAYDGIILFNGHQFFEAHEALEDAWKDVETEDRDLYRGILQIAVAYEHIKRGNYVGAVKVYQRSQKWLTKWPDFCQGVNVKQLLADARIVMDTLQELGADQIAKFDASLFKPIQYDQKKYICDRCGHEMYERNCKVICPNCGNSFDCSDLNIFFD